MAREEEEEVEMLSPIERKPYLTIREMMVKTGLTRGGVMNIIRKYRLGSGYAGTTDSRRKEVILLSPYDQGVILSSYVPSRVGLKTRPRGAWH